MEREFVFLPHDIDWARIRDGIVYDVPGAQLGHHGEDVSFDSILKKYGLTDPALELLAQIVRAADSHPSHPHPAGAGLRWIAHRFSALGLSDHEILTREWIVCDALYAECQRWVRAPIREIRHPLAGGRHTICTLLCPRRRHLYT